MKVCDIMKSEWWIVIVAGVLLLSCTGKTERNPRDPTHRKSVSHILIRFAGAAGDSKNITRSQQEARALAERVRTEIQAGEITFEDAVSRYSEDEMNRERNGFIGLVRQGYHPPDFENAVINLQPGQLSPVTQLKDGFHIFRVNPFKYRAFTHILISHRDADRVPLGVERSEEEAKKLIASLKQRVLDGEDMETLVREYSDGMEKKRGGYLPIFSEKQLISDLRPAWELHVGDLSEILESVFGYHLFQRVEPLPEVIGLKHIMISYVGAMQSPISVTRTRKEARDLAGDLHGRLVEGAVFEELAKKYSNDRSTRSSGGDLGLISWDEIPLEVEDVAFRMEVDTLSNVVESLGGFHILYRYQ